MITMHMVHSASQYLVGAFALVHRTMAEGRTSKGQMIA